MHFWAIILLFFASLTSAQPGDWKITEATDSWFLGSDARISSITPSQNAMVVTFTHLPTGEKFQVEDIIRIDFVPFLVPTISSAQSQRPSWIQPSTPISLSKTRPISSHNRPCKSLGSDYGTVRRILTDPSVLDPDLSSIGSRIGAKNWVNRSLQDGRIAYKSDLSILRPGYELVLCDDQLEEVSVICPLPSETVEWSTLNTALAIALVFRSLGLKKDLVQSGLDKISANIEKLTPKTVPFDRYQIKVIPLPGILTITIEPRQ